MRQPVLVLDPHRRVVLANRDFCDTFRVEPDAVEGCRIYEIGNDAWEIPALRRLIEEILPTESRVSDWAIRQDFPGLGRRDLRINASQLPPLAGFPALTLLAIEDVTVRQDVKQTLWESEERYRSLFAFSPLPTWVADRETFQFLAVNQAAIEHYGYSEEEFLRQTVRDLHAPDPVAVGTDSDTAYFSSPSVGEIAKHRTKNGSIIDVEVRRHPLQFNGRDARLVVVNDITKRSRYKRELENKTREILTIWESMTDAFFTVDTSWRFTYVNAQAETVLQRKRGELLGQRVWDEFPEAVDLAFHREYHRAMTEQVPVVFEEYFPPLDIWFEVHAYPSPVGLSVYFQDITERHRADETLQKSLALLQAVIEGTTDAVFVKDTEGRYLMINSEGAIIMGAPADQIIGRDDSAFFDAEMVEVIRENDRRTQEIGQARTYEETGTSNGIMRSFLATKAPYRDAAGNIIGIVGISRDITEQKKLRSQLEQSERLAAMGALVAGVAHELNNPLAAISGLAQLLQRHSDGMVCEDARTIQSMTERAARIVQSLLTFSRQANREDRQAQPLRPLIESSLDLMRYTLRESNVEVVFSLTEPDPQPVVISGQIEQVLLNLIGNAEYALRSRLDSREIRMTTEIRWQEGQSWATLSVSDNGTGISPDIRDRVFDPFFTTKPQGDGTGLGLSICHGIAEAHGGRLTITSDVGVGTEVTLWLPV